MSSNIIQIKKQIAESEKLKEEAKNRLAEHEKKIVGSKPAIPDIADTVISLRNLGKLR